MSQSLSGTVLVTGASVDERYLGRLRDAGLAVINPPASFPPDSLSESELRDLLADCDAYLLGGDEIASASALASATKLKVIAFLGVGYATYIDSVAAAKRGVLITNTPGVVANSVAEFAVCELVAARRRIVDFITSPNAPQVKRKDLRHHAVGVVGLGAVGTRICEILTKGFQAEVSYYSRTRKPDVESALGITYLPLHELVGNSEGLIIAVPDTPQTVSMIDKKLLEAHKTPLTVINISRPEVIAPSAMVWGLEKGRLENIWFDDYYHEPEPEIEDLRSDPRVRVTPHIASLTHDARDAMSEMSVTSLLNILREGHDPHIVHMPG